MNNSPFLVVQDFLSPLMCERIITDNLVKIPDCDINGDPIKLEHHIANYNIDISERFQKIIPDVEAKYNCNYYALESPLLQFFPENPKTPATAPGCENSKYLRKKWIKYKDVDLVGYIWLKDYNSEPPLDSRFEVYGGKIEFPIFNFSLVPQRGTLILFPAGPHFINVISPIMVGDLYQIKLSISIKTKDDGIWFYQPKDYPHTGNLLESWFKDYL